MEDQVTRERDRGGCSGDAGEPDRLSALPDCLLHSIMSMIKARQAVQTCVLSTRWRHLWRSVPCLDIDHYEFKQWEDLEDFAVNLMQRCNIAKLDSFRLCVSNCRPNDYKSWNAGGLVRRAIKYCAPVPCIIQREGLMSSSSSWRLKRLHLCCVFLDNRFAKHVSSACRYLEDLELTDCTCELPAITSRSLKNLVLKYCCFRYLSDITAPAMKTLVIDGPVMTDDCLIVITAPALSYLYLEVEYLDVSPISINEMPYLDNASIHLWDHRRRGNELGHKEFKLLCSVCNVTRLALSYLGPMVLSEESSAFKEFKNLRNLLLDRCYLSDDFQILVLFLQNSPNLEKLTLRHCTFSNDFKKKKGSHKPKEASSSQYQSLDVLCANLKFTEIIYKDEDVRQLVELLLRISDKLPNNHLKLTKVVQFIHR